MTALATEKRSLPKILDWRPRPWLQVLLALAALGPLWAVLDALLQFSRGIDLTDEGLFLLAASAESRDSVWMTPFGWVTGPLYRLAGQDLATFRGVGVLIHVSLAAGLALTASRALRGRSCNGIEGVVILTTGAMSGILFFAGLQRTPTHYWPHVTGALLVLIAMLRMYRGEGATSLPLNAALFAVGLLMMTAGRWPVALIALLTALAGSVLVNGWRSTAVFAGATGTVGGVLVAALIWSGALPPRPLAVFRAAAEAPPLEPSYEVLGALASYLAFPRVAWGTAPGIIIVAALVLGIDRLSRIGHLRFAVSKQKIRRKLLGGSVSLLVLAVTATLILYWNPEFSKSLGLMSGHSFTPLSAYLAQAARLWAIIVAPLACVSIASFEDARRRKILAGVLTLWAILQMNPLASTAFGGDGGPQQINPRVVNALIAVLLAAFVGVASTDTALRIRELLPRNSVTVALLGIFPFLLPAGTNQNLYRMLAVSSTILVALTLAVIATLKYWKLRLQFLALLLASVAVLTTMVVSDSHQHPFRSGPTSTQTSELCNAKGTSCFYVDDQRSQQLNELVGAASSAGWTPMTPLFALATPWSATITWLLSADIPQSIMFTLGALPGEEAHDAADALFRHNLQRIDGDKWNDAWILVTAESPPGNSRVVDRWSMDRDSSVRRARWAAVEVGKSFPQDYRLIWVSSDAVAVGYGERIGIELWAPRERLTVSTEASH